MRRLTVCMLVLGLSACGGGSGGSRSSGVTGSKPLTDINDAELEQLCDWSGKSSVSYKPTEAQFCTVLAVENSSELEECLEFAQQCQDSEGDLEFNCGLERDDLDGCEATVSEYERCVRAAGAAQREQYQSASCNDLGSTDSAPSLSACDALVAKCPWLGGDGDNPNTDDDDFDDDDGFDDDGFDDDDFGDGGFGCDDGEDLDDSWVCDGVADCSAGDDEDGCSSEPTFTCDDGGTTDLSYVCDGVADCGDVSDEASCDGGFVCADGVDVYDSAKCDGYPDCTSGDDEFDCPDSVDPVDPVDPALFTCLNGGRISFDWVCDGAIDCDDSSDESNCP